MSYFVTPSWIGFDGTPITGVIPPRLRLMSGVMTPTLASEVAHRYRIFHLNKQASRAEYLVSDDVLPDGSRVRIVANGKIEDVLVWASGDADRNPELPPIAYPVLIDLAYAPIYDRPVIDWTFTPEEYPPEPEYEVPYPSMRFTGVMFEATVVSRTFITTKAHVYLNGQLSQTIDGSVQYESSVIDGFGRITVVANNCPMVPLAWEQYGGTYIAIGATDYGVDNGGMLTEYSLPDIRPGGQPLVAAASYSVLPYFGIPQVDYAADTAANWIPEIPGNEYPAGLWNKRVFRPWGTAPAFRPPSGTPTPYGTLVSGSYIQYLPVSEPTGLSYDTSAADAVAAAQPADQAQYEADVAAWEAARQVWLDTVYKAWQDECAAVDERNAAKPTFPALKPYRMQGRATQIAAMNAWLDTGLGDMHLNRQILAFPYDVAKRHDPAVASIDLSGGAITVGSTEVIDPSLRVAPITLVDVTTETDGAPSGGGGGLA